MPRRHSSLTPTLIAVGIAAEVASPSAARAQENAHTFSPAVILSVTVGDKTAFGIGFDFRYTRFLQGGSMCWSGTPDVGIGPFAQVTWLNFSAWRFAGGMHLGGEVADLHAIEGELGWSFRSSYDDDHPGGHGPHLGVSALAFTAIEFSARGMIPWLGSPMQYPDLTLGLGYRALPVFGYTGSCGEGRPLREGDGYLLAPLFARPRTGRGRARAGRMDSTTRGALARAWALAGSAECSSVPAFMALARDLELAGAPPSLIGRALRAARDEIRHTALCCELAGDYAGADIAASPPPVPPPPLEGDRRSMLIRLAIESWQDGCLGEGAAAERARRSLRGATDARARAALRAIARDEQKHADLGWSIVSFCLEAGGCAVREALAAAIEMAEPTPADIDSRIGTEYDRSMFEAHGRLTNTATEMASTQTWEHARRRGNALLARRRPSTSARRAER